MNQGSLPDTRVRVLVADDQLLVRAGIRGLLERSSRYLLVGEAVDAADCIDKVRSLAPDLLLLDIALPDMCGIDAVGPLRSIAPSLKIVYLSAVEAREQVMRAIQAGADGFLSKDFAPSELEFALDSACSGRRFLSPRISQVLLQAMSPTADGNGNGSPNGNGSGSLTARQLEVLRCVAQGLSNKEIARELAISPKTVEFHRGQLMQRLGMHDVASLTRYAVRAGLV